MGSSGRVAIFKDVVDGQVVGVAHISAVEFDIISADGIRHCNLIAGEVRLQIPAIKLVGYASNFNCLIVGLRRYRITSVKMSLGIEPSIIKFLAGFLNKPNCGEHCFAL